MDCHNTDIETRDNSPNDEIASKNECKIKNVSFSTIVTIIEYQIISEVFSFCSNDHDDSKISTNLLLDVNINEMIDNYSDKSYKSECEVMILKNMDETTYKECNAYNPLYDMKLQLKIRKNNKFKYRSKTKVISMKSLESGCSVKSIFGKILNWM
mmetsp:Transcript_22013/g.20015  ORF Transcript_22013/g.20015 Transcript_22013/m.20015 type:complete len:155 (-) Transcript_22013:117-581(-)